MNELISKNQGNEITISEKEANELMGFVNGKVEEITALSNKIKNARSEAEKASKEAKKAQETAENIKKQTNNRGETHWYNGKATAINDVKDDTKALANAQVDLANAQIALAKAQQKSNEAQQKTLEFEEKLANLTTAMIQVGTTSIARSNFLVRELEARLKGASEEELSEMARKELELVVGQIKGQQDVLSRQEQLTDIVREMDDKMSAQDASDAIRDKAIEDQMQRGLERDLKISEQDRKNKEQDRVIQHESRKNIEQDKLIAEGAEKDKKQDAQISENAQDIDKLEQSDEEQDKRLDEGEQKDKEQDAQINENTQDIDELERQDAEQDIRLDEGDKKDAEQDQVIEQIQETDDKQNEILLQQKTEIEFLQKKVDMLENAMATRGNKKMLMAAATIAIIALVISIIQFFI